MVLGLGCLWNWGHRAYAAAWSWEVCTAWSHCRRGRGPAPRGGHVAASHVGRSAVCVQPAWARSWSGIAGPVGGCSASKAPPTSCPGCGPLSRSECLEGHEQSRQRWAWPWPQAGSVVGAGWVGHGGVISDGAGVAAFSPHLFPGQRGPQGARRGREPLATGTALQARRAALRPSRCCPVWPRLLQSRLCVCSGFTCPC